MVLILWVLKMEIFLNGADNITDTLIIGAIDTE